MILYIDYTKKNVYIMAPKCGSNSVAYYLNVDLHHEYTIKDELTNDDFKKYIIVKKDIVERFLSGFYEDLFNNTCYDNMEITFHEYLLFLYKCFTEKIPDVNNLSVYLNRDIPVWFGNDSNISLNITDSQGNFISHIITQKHAINPIIDMIEGENVTIVALSKLSQILPNSKKMNEKIKNKYDFKLSNIELWDIKKNRIIMSKDGLNKEEINLILKMYEEDTIMINDLINKYKEFKG